MTPERRISVSYTTGEAIDRLVGRIVEDVHPLRVLLFGSATRGELAAGSDIDLLVVMPDGTHRRRTAQHLYRRLHGIGIPFDILVTTPRDLDRHKDNIGLIYRTILLEGREVYAA
jgi:predicted nucleotidyltransferase